MAIPVRFTTVVLKKTAIENTYPGGVDAFVRAWSNLLQDENLVGRCYMSTGEADQFLDVLRSIGFDLRYACAVVDMFGGELDSCPGIEIRGAGQSCEAFLRE